MGLVQSSSSSTFTKIAAAPAGKAKTKGKRRAAKPAGGQTLLERLASPQVVAGTAAVGLAAVFVGLVASTFAKSPQSA